MSARLVAALLLLLVVLVVVIRILETASAGSNRSSASGGELTGPAPWPANADELRARLDALGLPALSHEGTALHIHTHLDVFVDGRRVIVPAGIGIDPQRRFISPLHTHDASGVIHVESPTVRRFTLGEFFGVWGVRLDRQCVGGYCTGHGRGLRVYANGRLAKDPRTVVLADQQEMVVLFGRTASTNGGRRGRPPDRTDG